MSLGQGSAPKKIMERVRSLLAMSNDTSSPNEASIALKRARSLMDEYQLEMSDIGEISKGIGVGSADLDTGSCKQKPWASAIAIAVAKMNDCIVRVKRNYVDDSGRYTLVYVFCGLRQDAEASLFMTKYIFDTCQRLYARDKKTLGIIGLAGKNDYLTGASRGICNRIRAIISEREVLMSKTQNSRSLIIAKKDMTVEHFGEGDYSEANRGRVFDKEAFDKGKAASKDVHLGSFFENHQPTGMVEKA